MFPMLGSFLIFFLIRCYTCEIGQLRNLFEVFYKSHYDKHQKEQLEVRLKWMLKSFKEERNLLRK